jgi:hypothetical protein
VVILDWKRAKMVYLGQHFICKGASEFTYPFIFLIANNERNFGVFALGNQQLR